MIFKIKFDGGDKGLKLETNVMMLGHRVISIDWTGNIQRIRLDKS